MLNFFVLIVLIGLIPAAIAKGKGRSFIGFWIYGSLLFIVALPHALIMKSNTKGLEETAIALGGRKCPHCAEIIKAEAKVCRFCQRDLPLEAGSGKPFISTDALVSQYSESQLMEQYGITFDGQYVFNEYRYDKFSDALNYAKAQKTAVASV